MKAKKFKLERKIVEEVYETLKTYLIKAKHIIAFIEAENTLEQHTSNMLILYCNSVLNYMLELEKLMIDGAAYYLVTADLVEKLNKHKKILVELEENLHVNSKYSLKVH
jgi:hypothetical protein